MAPVLEEAKTARNIYLPEGKWIDQNNGQTYQGPLWLNDYAAPLDVLPYFIKSDAQRVIFTASTFVIVFLVLLSTQFIVIN